MRADVVIVGGGVVGSSIAYHLVRDGFGGRVVVVERDPSYARASSNLAMGGIRQQFSSSLNVRLAQFSVAFYATFDDRMSLGHHRAHAEFCQRGYLFLVNPDLSPRFERRYAQQRGLGARVVRLTVDDIGRLVPGIYLEDIVWGLFGPEDGYANPRAVFAGFRAAAAAVGADFLKAEVVDVRRTNGRVTGVALDSGEAIDSPIVVNAAGPFAARIAAMAGLDLPIHPVRQQLFRATLPARFPARLPMIVDPSGVHWRQEDPGSDAADRIVVARTRLDEPAGENFTCDPSRWDAELLPPLVNRMPAYGALIDVEGWAGLYEMTPDHNPVIGEHPECPGLILANGFSGHGLMMAPATGKIVSELVRLGHCESFDIRPVRVDRFAAGQLFLDDAMI